MKSRNIMFAVLALVGIMLFGAVAQAEETVKLTVLNYLDATSPGAQRELEEIWDAFEKANPNIKIEREDLFNEPFHQKTEAYAAAGEIPDVLYMWPGGRSATLHTKGLVKDLTPLLGEEINQFSEAAMTPQAGGYLGEIPTSVTATHVLYTNKALLKELGLEMPKTYEDFVAMVPTLKAAGKDVILMGAQDDWVMQSCLFSMVVGRLLGDDYLNDLLAGKVKFTDKPFVDALRFHKRLFDDGVLSVKSLQTPYNEVNALFASGKAPFMIDGAWKVGNFLTDPSTGEALIPVDQQDNFEMVVFPAIPGEINHNTTASVPGTGFGMNADIPAGSAKEKAAWKLIQWLTGPETQLIRLETGGAVPSRKGVTSDKLEPLMQECLEFYGEVAGTAVIDNVFDPKVYGPINVGLQEIGLGFATPEEVAQRTQKAYDEWAK